MKHIFFVFTAVLFSTFASAAEFIPEDITPKDLDQWAYGYYKDVRESKICPKDLYVGLWINTHFFSRNPTAGNLYKVENNDPITLSFGFNPSAQNALYFNDTLILPIVLNYDKERYDVTPAIEPAISYNDPLYREYFIGNYFFSRGELYKSCRVLDQYNHQVMICRSGFDEEQGKSQGWDVFQKVN